ncbi:hypothetical protein WN55_09556 [Dufourea novaeangliae]|uniref:Uncharacterized protein n=1 Tax=Dufourea novaeangliae TaxID=178035 RepID=A0A154NYQ6_DUFNO|nr:hypothetical protein WN55_09556 [Dufourea novaeangliae]
MDGLKLARWIRRYWPILFFPTVSVSLIYADWSHTREWKKKVAEGQKLDLLS